MVRTDSLKTRVLVSGSPSGELRPFVDSINIHSSSHRAPWDEALSAELDRIEPGELEQCYIRRTTIVQPLADDDIRITRFGAPRRPSGIDTMSNEIHIDPSGTLTGARWTKPVNILFLMPSDLTFQRVLQELQRPPSHLELMRSSYVQDAQIRQIGLAILAECHSGFPSGRIYGESLALALTARLVTQYSHTKYVLPNDQKGLPTWRFRRVAEFIEDNLSRELGLSELAAVAQFSEFHFSRMFKRSTGLTPHRYVMERRIAQARNLLTHSPLSLHEISAMVGFSDQSHMTTVFKRLTGVTPGQFRDKSR